MNEAKQQGTVKVLSTDLHGIDPCDYLDYADDLIPKHIDRGIVQFYLSMVWRAILDLDFNIKSKRYKSAYKWIFNSPLKPFNPNLTYLSFGHICNALDLDVEYVRLGILTLRNRGRVNDKRFRKGLR